MCEGRRMNQVYRVVFNRSLGVWQCVSELAKASGKSSGKVAKPLIVAMSLISGSAMATDYTTSTTITDNPYLPINDTVSGTGTVVNTPNTILVGDANTGSLTIQQGGVFNAGNTQQASHQKVVIANQANSTGTVTVSGANSQIDNTYSTLVVGQAGTGTLTINDGAIVKSNITVAKDTGSKGEVTIDGLDTTLIGEDLSVGENGIGTATVSNGAKALGANLSVTADHTGQASFIITGQNSQANYSDNVSVGWQGTGKNNLIVKDGGKLTADAIALGYFTPSQDNTVTVSNGTILVANASVGVAGAGQLNIDNNGVFKASENLYLGKEQDGKGIATVNNSVIQVAGLTTVGKAGQGSLNIISSNDKSSSLFTDTLIIGDEANSHGEVKINTTANPNDSHFLSAVQANHTITLGNNNGATGTITTEGDLALISAPEMVIGNHGIGTYNTNHSFSTATDGDWYNVTANIGKLTLGKETDGEGIINVNKGAFEFDNLVLGEKGKATINADDGWILAKGNIERATTAQKSDIFLNGTLVDVRNTQNQFFKNFTKDNKIEGGAKGIKFSVGDTSVVTLDPKAVITGNVGQFDDSQFPNQMQGGFIKYGEGDLVMSANNMQWAGDTIALESKVIVNDDYKMKTGDRLGVFVDFNPDGMARIDNEQGRFIFNGKADISEGDFHVTLLKNATKINPDNVWKDIITAKELVGHFKTVTDNSPLVDFYADYSDPNKVHLQLTAPVVAPPVVTPPVTPPVVTPEPPVVTLPVTPPVVTPQPPVVTPPVTPPVVTPPVTTPVTPTKSSTFVQAVKQYKNLSTLDLASVLDNAIDNKITTGTNALADTLISTTLNYNQAQLSQGTSELQPLFIGSVNRMITDSNNLATTAIIDQSTQRERNVWAKAIGTQSTKDHDSKIMGYQAKDAGIIAGADTAINDKLNLGMAMSYIHTDADSNGHAIDHEMTAKNWQILGYGDYQATDDTRANFHIGAGQSDIKGERHIKTFGQTTAKSDYNADTFQAEMGVSHRIGTEQQNISPFARINYNQVKSDAYHETGAGAFSLDVREKTYNSLRTTLGVNVKQALTPQIAVTGTLAGALENGDPRTDITVSFSGTPDTTFTTKGREVGREVGIAGLGLSYKPTANTKASINYMGEWRKNYDSQGVALVVSSKF